MTTLSEYDYELPSGLVAQHPLAVRSDARMMVVRRKAGVLEHLHIRDLPGLLEANDTVVINNTRVLPARLVGFRTKTGGRWQGLYLRHDSEGRWQVLSRTRGRLKPGETVTLEDHATQAAVRLTMLTPLPDGSWLASPQEEASVDEILQRVGRVPLPPYIRSGQMEPADTAHYQTVFARVEGSVAAPTAGLHFTSAVIDQIKARQAAVCELTLHVGLGTFRPIACEKISDHQMHAEWGELTAEVADEIAERRGHGGRVIAVGTTSARILETAGGDGELKAWCGETSIFIRPPYEFRAIDGLLTNFHLPRTTLLVMIRTFGGDELIRQAYQEAIALQYRFYSYGDAMLIMD